MTEIPPDPSQPAAVPLVGSESAGVPALEKITLIEVAAQNDRIADSKGPEGAGAPATSDGEDALQTALAPVRNRMERVKMPVDFVRNLLHPNAEIKLQSAAMQWAGMPNKNERAALHEVLQALVAGGFLKQTADETYSVIHVPSQ